MIKKHSKAKYLVLVRLGGLLLLVLAILGIGPLMAQEGGLDSAQKEAKDEPEGPRGKLTILTSYPKVLTDEFRRAFEKKFSEVEVEVVKKKTGAGIEHLKKTRDQNITDLYWVSAPDAMENLKKAGLLLEYRSRSPGLPRSVSGYPTNDPDGLYTGFAASGYGIMWNQRYTDAKGLPDAVNWEILTTPAYYGHVGMSSPSRSGTTHLAVEAILQGYGWQDGWALIKAIGGNLSTVTAKSSHVPKGVEQGEFAAGVVIDFYGLSSRARRYPVQFAYPEVTTLVPANIALVKHGPNPEAAKAFIEFLLSEYGQSLLLEPEIRRLPLRPEIYNRAPDDFPNPFKDPALKEKLKFDVALSAQRYAVINALFDVMVTFTLDELRAVTRVLHDLRRRLQASESPNATEARQLLAQAEQLVNYVPINELHAQAEQTVRIFKKKRKKASDKLEGDQARVELGWQERVRNNYVQATELATAGLAMLH